MGTDEINDVGSSWRKVIRTLESDDRVSPRQRGFVVLAQAQGLIGTTLLVAVPNELTREVLQTQLKHILDEVLRGVFQADIQCAFVIDADMLPAASADPEPEPEDPAPSPVPSGESAPSPTPPSTSQEFGRLNPKYVFETFVIGSSNRFAHAAAVAVAEAPANRHDALMQRIYAS